jgi:predicted O-methyltransferase YrrM
MTALIDTLFQLEKYLGLELDSLLPYAEMDDLGGFHPDPAQAKWDVGAIFAVEGQTLYALIRALKPLSVVEIGSGKGCSTNHIASALKVNDIEQFEHVGHVVTLDRGNTPAIDGRWGSYVTVLNGDAFDYLEAQPDNSIDFILEDAAHSEAMCYRVGELAKTKLRPGGVLMAHDAVHPTVGRDVRAGYDRAGLDFRTYLTDPSDCGWAVWKRPVVYNVGAYSNDGMNWTSVRSDDPEQIAILNKMADESLAASLADTEPVLQAQEDKPPAKAKRTRKAKPKAKK